MIYFARLMLFLMLSLCLHLLLGQIGLSRSDKKVPAGFSQGVNVVTRSSDDFLRSVAISRSVELSVQGAKPELKTQSNTSVKVSAMSIKQPEIKKEIVPKVLEKKLLPVAEPVQEVVSVFEEEAVSDNEIQLSVDFEKVVVGPVSESIESVVENEDEPGFPPVEKSEEHVESISPVVEQGQKNRVIFEQALPRYSVNPSPVYPAIASRRGQQGTVELKVLVNKDGSVGKLKIENSSGFKTLDRAALKAVRFWQFKPALNYGLPVESWVIVPVDFVLE